jgi:hypothetical protein
VRPVKSILLFVYGLAAIVAVGSALSYFWAANKELRAQSATVGAQRDLISQRDAFPGDSDTSPAS